MNIGTAIIDHGHEVSVVSVSFATTEQTSSGRFWPSEDSGHGLLWQGGPGTQQEAPDLSCHEDTGQTEGGQAQGGGTHSQWEEDPQRHQLPLLGQHGVQLQSEWMWSWGGLRRE